MSYTYADIDYPALPSLKDWVGQEKYYYDSPGGEEQHQKHKIMKLMKIQT